MSPQAGALAVGLVVVGLAALFYTGSVNRDLAAIHRRLDEHQRFIGVLATLMPVVRPIPPDRPEPQQEEPR